MSEEPKMYALTDKQFIDWFSIVFPYGYGTGEKIFLKALKGFMDSLDNGRMYNYEVLESTIGKDATWFLINMLIKADIIGYGTSPRFAWIQDEIPEIAALRDYIISHTEDEMYESVTRNDQDYVSCFKDMCQCGENCNSLLKYT